jgi:hypothetical protein
VDSRRCAVSSLPAKPRRLHNPWLVYCPVLATLYVTTIMPRPRFSTIPSALRWRRLLSRRRSEARKATPSRVYASSRERRGVTGLGAVAQGIQYCMARMIRWRCWTEDGKWTLTQALGTKWAQYKFTMTLGKRDMMSSQYRDNQYVVVDYASSRTFHLLFSPQPEMNKLLLENCSFRSKGEESDVLIDVSRHSSNTVKHLRQ